MTTLSQSIPQSKTKPSFKILQQFKQAFTKLPPAPSPKCPKCNDKITPTMDLKGAQQLNCHKCHLKICPVCTKDLKDEPHKDQHQCKPSAEFIKSGKLNMIKVFFSLAFYQSKEVLKPFTDILKFFFTGRNDPFKGIENSALKAGVVAGLIGIVGYSIYNIIKNIPNADNFDGFLNSENFKRFWKNYAAIMVVLMIIVRSKWTIFAGKVAGIMFAILNFFIVGLTMYKDYLEYTSE